VFLYSRHIKKLQSDNWVVCSGSCNECIRCRRLYCSDAADNGGSRACSTWFRVIPVARPGYRIRPLNTLTSVCCWTHVTSLSQAANVSMNNG